ncbi:RRP12-like protein [Zootermopsis nevadensis]|uniref:RRP12-like protein n=1 Tax=Zootermopsis nevadensis TaxID=136037 RepID=A0A067QRH2_ZOONE|nr:RRP12-like protein [Zootermopsis nevadensis]
MTEDCKHHFRLKTRNLFDRLVRKFGFETIVAIVPASDLITHKRLRNLRKIHSRKKKMQAKDAIDENESDLEESFSVKSRPKRFVNSFYYSWMMEAMSEVVRSDEYTSE